jgi:pyrimidine-nucleoside phosphorylase
MRVVDLIRKKRDSQELTRDEIAFLIDGYTRNEIPDYQFSAWLMAVWLRGMTRAELAALTETMLHSGEVLDWSNIPGKKVDKHSTGGVGDKTSLVLAPIVAAAGLFVPMISGRGLGHSGGTLDKLESIPGFNVNLSLAEFGRVLRECGFALIGQTAEIAPADKKIYSLRDVTSTVDSPYLICASIMSKKLAEGISALVLDVKTGSGAFMKKDDDAVHLAELMVETGQGMGKKVVALITDMNQPLGQAAGNSLEVAECIEVLSGRGPQDLRDLCIELSGWMLYLGERSNSVEEGKRLAAEMIANGRAKDKFRDVIRLQGGDPSVVDQPSKLPRARSTFQIKSTESGYIGSIECENLGIACNVLGGGRETKEDIIDPAVGLTFHKRIKEYVEKDEPLATVHYNTETRLPEAKALIQSSYRIVAEEPREELKLVKKVIAAGTDVSVEKL